MNFNTKLYLLLISIFLISPLAQSQELNWVNKFGLASHDVSYSIANDADGNVYITGEFNGAVDFDPGPGSEVLVSSAIDAYVLKLTADGDFVWAKNFGGPEKDVARSICIDNSNNVIVAGEFRGTGDFDPGDGVANLTSAGLVDGFILSLDSDGNYIWSKSIGGPENDNITGVSADYAGNVYTTGYFLGTMNADPGASDFSITSNGNSDAFITRHSAMGSFLNAGNVGGTGNDRGNAIVADSAGNVYTTGYFYSTVDFDPGAGTENISSSGQSDVFLLKLDQDFNFVWANKSVSGTANNRAYAITLYDDSMIYLTGAFNNTADFDPGVEVDNLVSHGSGDIFVQKIDSDGEFVWAKNVGGTEYEEGDGIAVDEYGNVYTTGYYNGTPDFDPGVDTVAIPSSGSRDCFVLMLEADGNYSWAVHLGGGAAEIGRSISVYNSVYVYTGGEFLGTANFDPNGTYNLSAAGGKDIFIHKMYHCFETTASVDTVVCESYVSPSGDYTWTETGIYMDTLVNASGCDSVLTINLTINPVSAVEFAAEACYEYESPSGLYTWTESGIYNDTLTNVYGCDSIITVDLTINHSAASEINISACESYTSPSGSYTWEESGIYNDTLTTISGCDSVLVIDLTINENSYATVIDSGCVSYTSPSGLYTWYESGAYTDTLLNVAGCDSIITLELEINNVNVAVEVSGITLTATAEGAGFVWVDCDNDYTPVDDATDASYTPDSGSGNFAVIVTQGECTDTSECYAVSNIGLTEDELIKATLYPNPAQDQVTIDLVGTAYEEVLVSVYGFDGKLVEEIVFYNDSLMTFELKGESGVYFVALRTNQNQVGHFKVTKL